MLVKEATGDARRQSISSYVIELVSSVKPICFVERNTLCHPKWLIVTQTQDCMPLKSHAAVIAIQQEWQGRIAQ